MTKINLSPNLNLRENYKSQPKYEKTGIITFEPNTAAAAAASALMGTGVQFTDEEKKNALNNLMLLHNYHQNVNTNSKSNHFTYDQDDALEAYRDLQSRGDPSQPSLVDYPSPDYLGVARKPGGMWSSNNSVNRLREKMSDGVPWIGDGPQSFWKPTSTDPCDGLQPPAGKCPNTAETSFFKYIGKTIDVRKVNFYPTVLDNSNPLSSGIRTNFLCPFNDEGLPSCDGDVWRTGTAGQKELCAKYLVVQVENGTAAAQVGSSIGNEESVRRNIAANVGLTGSNQGILSSLAGSLNGGLSLAKNSKQQHSEVNVEVGQSGFQVLFPIPSLLNIDPAEKDRSITLGVDPSIIVSFLACAEPSKWGKAQVPEVPGTLNYWLKTGPPDTWSDQNTIDAQCYGKEDCYPPPERVADVNNRLKDKCQLFYDNYGTHMINTTTFGASIYATRSANYEGAGSSNQVKVGLCARAYSSGKTECGKDCSQDRSSNQYCAHPNEPECDKRWEKCSLSITEAGTKCQSVAHAIPGQICNDYNPGSCVCETKYVSEPPGSEWGDKGWSCKKSPEVAEWAWLRESFDDPGGTSGPDKPSPIPDIGNKFDVSGCAGLDYSKQSSKQSMKESEVLKIVGGTKLIRDNFFEYYSVLGKYGTGVYGLVMQQFRSIPPDNAGHPGVDPAGDDQDPVKQPKPNGCSNYPPVNPENPQPPDCVPSISDWLSSVSANPTKPKRTPGTPQPGGFFDPETVGEVKWGFYPLLPLVQKAADQIFTKFTVNEPDGRRIRLLKQYSSIYGEWEGKLLEELTDRVAQAYQNLMAFKAESVYNCQSAGMSGAIDLQGELDIPLWYMGKNQPGGVGTYANYDCRMLEPEGLWGESKSLAPLIADNCRFTESGKYKIPSVCWGGCYDECHKQDGIDPAGWFCSDKEVKRACRLEIDGENYDSNKFESEYGTSNEQAQEGKNWYYVNMEERKQWSPDGQKPMPLNDKLLPDDSAKTMIGIKKFSLGSAETDALKTESGSWPTCEYKDSGIGTGNCNKRGKFQKLTGYGIPNPEELAQPPTIYRLAPKAQRKYKYKSANCIQGKGCMG